jgi:hypothetical protein
MKRTDISSSTIDLVIRLVIDHRNASNVYLGLFVKNSDYFIEYFQLGCNYSKKYKYGNYSNNEAIHFEASEHSPETVHICVQFLYTGIIEIPKRSTEQPNVDGPFTVLAHAYVFGEKVLDAPFCNAVVDAFVGMHIRTGTVQFPDCIKIVYEKMAAGSPMRRFFADIYAYNLADDTGLTDVLEGFPKEFWSI